MQSLWGNGHLHCSSMVRCCEIFSLSVYHLNRTLIGSLCLTFGKQFFYFSENTQNLQPIHRKLDPVWKTSYFIPSQDPRWPCCPEGGFEFMVLIFFWKYIKFAIDWYIIWVCLGTLILHPMGSPQGGPLPSCGLMYSCALIASYIFGCLGVRNIWAKFHVFITICTILTLSCASGLDYTEYHIQCAYYSLIEWSWETKSSL